jgi:hypothetical protein
MYQGQGSDLSAVKGSLTARGKILTIFGIDFESFLPLGCES